jgi:hypothetical protein
VELVRWQPVRVRMARSQRGHGGRCVIGRGRGQWCGDEQPPRVAVGAAGLSRDG